LTVATNLTSCGRNGSVLEDCSTVGVFSYFF
jgi:hypothetical protein